jgi:uncharacterized DUF497 family protein
MRISRFEWDEWNINHIAAHSVTPEEVEEVFIGRHMIKSTRDSRYIALGQTEEGRYLTIVFEQKQRSIRVITARDMTQSERRLFLRH